MANNDMDRSPRPRRALGLLIALGLLAACDCDGEPGAGVGEVREMSEASEAAGSSESTQSSGTLEGMVAESDNPEASEDADGDGVALANDRCPDEPEDCDGFQDDDGCPDPDNDGDGIPDVCDACPDAQETPNGYRSEDGCPDVAPSPSDLPMLFFRRGGDTPRSMQPLDAWAAALTAQPTLTAQLLGAASPGTSAAVRQARAEVALEGLVSRGIDRTRLTVTDQSFMLSGDIAIQQGLASEQARLAHGGPIPSVVMAQFGRRGAGEIVPRQCPPTEPSPAVACPAARTDVLPSRHLGDGVHRVVPEATIADACAQLIKSEYPLYAEGCFRISENYPGTGPIRSVSVVGVEVGGDGTDYFLLFRTPAGYEYFARIGGHAWDVSTFSSVGVDELQFDQIVDGGNPEVLVRWSRVTTGGDEGPDGVGLYYERAAYLTLCSFADVPLCRSFPTRVQFDASMTREPRISSWDRRRASVAAEWLPDGRVRITADGAAGMLAPLVGTHRWPDLPTVESSAL